MHPIDTIKTRLQVGIGNDDDDEQQEETQWQRPPNAGNVALMEMRSSTATTAEAAVSRSAGLFDNLYEGLTGNLFKEVPPSAVYLGVYETVKYALAPKVAPVYL